MSNSFVQRRFEQVMSLADESIVKTLSGTKEDPSEQLAALGGTRLTLALDHPQNWDAQNRLQNAVNCLIAHSSTCRVSWDALRIFAADAMRRDAWLLPAACRPLFSWAADVLEDEREEPRRQRRPRPPGPGRSRFEFYRRDWAITTALKSVTDQPNGPCFGPELPFTRVDGPTTCSVEGGSRCDAVGAAWNRRSRTSVNYSTVEKLHGKKWSRTTAHELYQRLDIPF